jgi:hypothetical protein
MKTKHFFLFLLASFVLVQARSQHLELPWESQYAEVTQRIGLTDIKVTYHSPAVKGRKIFGELVPYGEVWRAGANENTTISFTDEVEVEGKKIPAGTYGLHMIPGKDEWTVIFSSNSTSWGSYYYQPLEDVARVQVKPVAHGFTEWLNYEFTDRSSSSATLSLVWENVQVPVRIGVDSKNIVLNHIRQQHRSIEGYTWEGWYNAAKYCYDQRFNYDEALAWAERAELFKPGDFSTIILKADLMAAKGDAAGAEKIRAGVLANASETDLNAYGYALDGEGKTKEALEVFRTNVKRHPDSWNAHDSLGEILLKTGDKKGARAEYEAALKKAPEKRKPVIQKIIDGLK